jgi:hypothetical protein
MLTQAATHRTLKARMRDLLLDADFDQTMVALTTIPARRAVNPLFSFFCSDIPLLRWRAVSGMGVVVSHLADTEMESARVVLRRLMWTLNDESGGIGWGAPEAMGEITARHAALAAEFARILVSYIRPDANFLEHPLLQRGLLWGLGRLAHGRMELAREAMPFVRPFLGSADACHRGHAAWFMRAFASAGGDGDVTALNRDMALFPFYLEGHLREVTVAEASLGKMPPLGNENEP